VVGSTLPCDEEEARMERERGSEEREDIA